MFKDTFNCTLFINSERFLSNIHVVLWNMFWKTSRIAFFISHTCIWIVWISHWWDAIFRRVCWECLPFSVTLCYPYSYDSETIVIYQGWLVFLVIRLADLVYHWISSQIIWRFVLIKSIQPNFMVFFNKIMVFL